MSNSGLIRGGAIAIALFVFAAMVATAQSGGSIPQNLVAKSDGPSGQKWIGGNRGSPFMNPGLDCIACHKAGEGPVFAIAGTVYTKLDEKDLDLGVAGVDVVVTDANGQVVKMTTNASGNFFARRVTLAYPIKAKVVYKGKERAMMGGKPTGECMLCHTASGKSGAPGRIAIP